MFEMSSFLGTGAVLHDQDRSSWVASRNQICLKARVRLANNIMVHSWSLAAGCGVFSSTDSNWWSLDSRVLQMLKVFNRAGLKYQDLPLSVSKAFTLVVFPWLSRVQL